MFSKKNSLILVVFLIFSLYYKNTLAADHSNKLKYLDYSHALGEYIYSIVW